MSPSIISLGRDVLNRNGVTDHRQLIGFHVRGDQEFSRSNRNSKFVKYIDSIVWLEQQGYTIIRLGHGAKKTSSKIGNNSLDISSLELSSEERDAVNIYVWAISKFFVGNLSGGTFPPSLFGTPTIYIDLFPYTAFAIPGLRDAILPKKLFCLKSQRFLTIDEVFSETLTNTQIEDPLQLAIHGYQLIGCASDEILRAIILFEAKLKTSYAVNWQSKAIDLSARSFRLSEFKRRLLIQ